MTARGFELAAIGGPWGKRLLPRRAWLDDLPWDEALPRDAEGARLVWTRTAFSEYASAAGFAEIAAALLAAGAPIDLVAAAGNFVVDEIVHTEAAARVAAALGGAVPLEVDLTRLVRPPGSRDPLRRAAELVVRVSCVGEAMTVPILKASRRVTGSSLIEAVLGRVIADEASHAQLGWWFLDWAEPRLDDAARARLGRIAGAAIRAFAPLVGGGCRASGLGAIACDLYDPALAEAARRQVVRPLAARGIAVPAEDLEVLAAAAEKGRLREAAPAGPGADRARSAAARRGPGSGASSPGGSARRRSSAAATPVPDRR